MGHTMRTPCFVFVLVLLAIMSSRTYSQLTEWRCHSTNNMLHLPIIKNSSTNWYNTTVPYVTAERVCRMNGHRLPRPRFPDIDCLRNYAGSLLMSFLGPAGINASTALTLDAGMGCPEAREKQMVLLPDSQIVEKNVSERFRFVCYESLPFCTALSPLANGFISYSNSRRTYSYAQMTCEAGFQLIGNGTLYCNGNQTWIGSIPECRSPSGPDHPCGLLMQPDNGSINYIGTTTAVFFCNEGYEVAGEARLTCSQVSGSQGWSGPEPNCTRVPACAELTKPEYGSISVFTSQQMPIRAEFTCLPGAAMSGDKVLHCQPDNTWSGVPAECNGTGLFDTMNVTDNSSSPVADDRSLIVIIGLGSISGVSLALSIILIGCCRKQICMVSAAYKVEPVPDRNDFLNAATQEQQCPQKRETSEEAILDGSNSSTASVV